MIQVLFAVYHPWLLAARHRSANEIELIILAVTAVTVGILAIIIAIGKAEKSRRERQLDALADSNYKKWHSAVLAAGGHLPRRELPIHLTKGEVGYFHDPTAALYEPRAVRDGRAGGASVRVMKGITIHSGGFRSESHDEWRKIATGALYVTDKRIIFDGDMKNRTIPLADVMSVVPGYRDACVNSHKLQKPVAFGDINGQVFAAIVNALCPT